MTKTILAAGSATDVGRVRKANQDSKLLENGIFAVADGMGGHQGGEVASAIAVEVLGATVLEPTEHALVAAAVAANTAVHERASEDADLRGMGTTLCALTLVETDDGGDDELAWINVGDSRIYLFRDPDLFQLTTDHSLVSDLLRDGQITAEEAAVHPQRNIVTRALGIEAKVLVDSGSVLPLNHDRYVLCSDGLFNEVTDDQIKATLRRLVNPNEAAAELVRLANEGGGRDNITVVVVDVLDDGGRSAAASAALAAAEAARHQGDDITEVTTQPVLPASGSGAPEATTTAAAAAAAGPKPSAVRPDDPDDLAGFTTPAPTPVAAPPRDRNDELWDKAVQPDDRDHLGSELDHARVRRVTWRVGAFFLAILAIAAGAIGFLQSSWNASYFVGANNGQVVIYHGKPDGWLWNSKSVAQRSDVKVSDLQGVAQDQVNSKAPTIGSKAAAVSLLHKLTSATTTTTTAPPKTTTTTTAPPTTAPVTIPVPTTVKP